MTRHGIIPVQTPWLALTSKSPHGKLRKYRHLNTNYYVVPIGIETLGSFGPHALKSVNLQYNTVERRVAGTTIPLSDGPMFILIDW
jgi:hypothetical protein